MTIIPAEHRFAQAKERHAESEITDAMTALWRRRISIRKPVNDESPPPPTAA